MQRATIIFLASFSALLFFSADSEQREIEQANLELSFASNPIGINTTAQWSEGRFQVINGNLFDIERFGHNAILENLSVYLDFENSVVLLSGIHFVLIDKSNWSVRKFRINDMQVIGFNIRNYSMEELFSESELFRQGSEIEIEPSTLDDLFDIPKDK